MDRMRGTVKFWNEEKGWGFITADDGEDYFTHVTGLDGAGKMTKGESVTFNVEVGRRGRKAVEVRAA